jgi:hypothetical protein
MHVSWDPYDILISQLWGGHARISHLSQEKEQKRTNLNLDYLAYDPLVYLWAK